MPPPSPPPHTHTHTTNTHTLILMFECTALGIVLCARQINEMSSERLELHHSKLPTLPPRLATGKVQGAQHTVSLQVPTSITAASKGVGSPTDT